MNSSEETCLLCLSTNKNMIKFHSETGKELNVLSILSTHFWFQLDEIKALPQNICRKCWKKTESFHEFYQSVRAVHKKFETVFVKIENDEVAADDGDEGEVLHQYTITDVKQENDLNIEDDNDCGDDEYLHEIPYANPIDTENRAFESMSSKTQVLYQSAYKRLTDWKAGENIDKECFSEAVMLEYFHYLKSKCKPSSLWAFYSMLKVIIKKNDNIDINYPEVISLLKNSSVDFQSQSVNVFQPEDLRRFLTEADDLKHLALKVITIFMIYGAHRVETLSKVNVSDVTKQGSVFVIKLPDASTNVMRSHTLENEYGAIVQKYIDLRPKKFHLSRFFVSYHNGECRNRPIGKNTFCIAPKMIANFLNLKDAGNYTLQSFSRKSKRSGRTYTRGARETTNSVDTSATETAPTSGKEVRVAFDLLPSKTQESYMAAYKNFLTWKASEDIDADCFTKEVLLDYLNYLKTKYKPNSVWSEYSKLRTTIQKHNNINIQHPLLTGTLKLNSVLCSSQTTYVFQPDDMRRFLDQARDIDYLHLKVIMIFAMYGTGSVTLSRVDVNDVSAHGSVVVVKLPEKKGDTTRSYTVENEYATFVQKYIDLRPEDVKHTRFFLQYKNGKCTAQPLGACKIKETAKLVAKFLNIKVDGNLILNSFHKKKQRKQCLVSVPENFIEKCIPEKRQIDDEIPVKAKRICKDTTALELLLGKSKEKYIRAYENFFVWKNSKNIDKDCFSEELMLEYFNYLKPKLKASSLWTEYSILRTTIQKNDNIDIAHPKLKAFMKDMSAGYQFKKSNEFRPGEIQNFFSKADDNKYLAIKVGAIIGMYVAISAGNLIRVEVNDVTEDGSKTVIKAPDKKTKEVRSFIVDSEHATYVQMYAKLRPKDTPHNRFMLNYQNGKCTAVPMGRVNAESIPKLIAKFLNLQNPGNYRFSSFNKTLSKCRYYGGLRSSNVVDDSTEESNSTNENVDDEIAERMCLVGSSEPEPPASFQTAFQTYNIQPHQVPPLHYIQSGQRQTMDGMGTSTVGTSNIPTAFQSYHVPPHQIQSYPLQYGGLNMTPNNEYGPR